MLISYVKSKVYVQEQQFVGLHYTNFYIRYSYNYHTQFATSLNIPSKRVNKLVCSCAPTLASESRMWAGGGVREERFPSTILIPTGQNTYILKLKLYSLGILHIKDPYSVKMLFRFRVSVRFIFSRVPLLVFPYLF